MMVARCRSALFGLWLFIPILLAGCAGVVPAARGPAAPPVSAPAPPRIEPAKPAARSVGSPVETGVSGEQSAALPLRQGPALASLSIAPDDAQAALVAFRTSCPSLLRRTDQSGLTHNEDWRSSCEAATGWRGEDALTFFIRNFETLQVDDGKAFATGYFLPEIVGARQRQRGLDVPVYGVPSDLIEVDLGQFSDEWKGKRIRGKVEAQRFVPYEDRAAIDAGALAGRAEIIAWAADPIDLFFLQVQGSGQLRASDGTIMRIGYAGQNGRDYTGIGRLMRDRGLLGPGQTNMQGIVDWLRAHPQEGKAIMEENKSYIFFRELDDDGARGALGYPVVAESSIAADPRYVPLGAPLVLSMDRAEPNGLWVAQDTGGAIKGPNRFDTFWGAGDRARMIAGGMSARGTAFLLLPIGTLDRLAAGRN